jgi:uncharacterized protein YcfJ
MIPPTLDEWSKMTEAQRKTSLRIYNVGGLSTGAIVGFAIGGPVGAVVGGIAGFFIGNHVVNTNLPRNY